MTIHARQADRINSLETGLKGFRGDIGQLNQRIGRDQTPLQAYWAKTVVPNEGEYPSSGNVYPVVFLEPDGAGGNRPLNPSNPKFVYNLDDTPIPVGTEVAVYSINQQWYTSWCCGEVDPGDPCLICYDDFQRTNVTSGPCGWTATLGNLLINDGYLETTSSTGAARMNKPHPSATVSTGRVLMSGTIPWTGGSVRAIVNYVAVDEYDWVEIYIGGLGSFPRIQIGQTRGGGDTVIATSYAVNPQGGLDYFFRFCADWQPDGTVSAFANDFTNNEMAVSGTLTSQGTNRYSGVQFSQGARIADFDFSRSSSEQTGCPSCPSYRECGTCCEGREVTSQWVIDFGPDAPTNNSYDRCDLLAGEFVVYIGTSGSGCGGENSTVSGNWTYLASCVKNFPDVRLVVSLFIGTINGVCGIRVTAHVSYPTDPADVCGNSFIGEWITGTLVPVDPCDGEHTLYLNGAALSWPGDACSNVSSALGSIQVRAA